MFIACSAGASESVKSIDAAPIVSRGIDVYGDMVFKAGGPIYESKKGENGEVFYALRPFYSSLRQPAARYSRQEFLWPMGVSRCLDNYQAWRFLLVFGRNFDTSDSASRYKIWGLPIYFQGRDINGENYFAIFPVGGTIHEILARDKVSFVLFPIWIRHSVNDVVTDGWLFPIISRTRGPGISRFRVFPFYGTSYREGGFRKRFIMWPFWTDSHWLREGSKGYGYIFFPFWGHTKTEIEETWNILPPIFRFTRGERRNLTYAPWPFYQRVVGSGVDKLYLWPFWGRKVMEMEMKSFFIWPIGWHSRFDKGETVRIRTKILPFYYHYTESWKVESGSKEEKPISRYFKLWPLYSYDRDGENSELRCLALCPGRNPGPIDRNWAPLWNVYKRSRAGDKVESELLWGIYRHKKDGTKKRSFTLFPLFSWERDEGCRGWTFLNGLVGRKKNGIDTSWQLLYLFKTGKNGEEQ